MRLLRLMAVAMMIGFSGWVCAAVETGQPAPDFSTADLQGNPRALSEFKGKFVVLEWFNYDCPFVKKHYSTGNMQNLQKTYAEKGVIWFSINSSAPGKQGNYPPDQMKKMSEDWSTASTEILLDPDGTVGKMYGAKTTPHLFIIAPEGKLIYMGAIDDRPSTNPEDVKGATNYVQKALDEAMNGQEVSEPVTQSYGCSVKY